MYFHIRREKKRTKRSAMTKISSKTCLLTADHMQEKITRMAFEILETHVACKSLTLLGVGRRGMCLAKQLAHILQPLGNFSLEIEQLHMLRNNKKQPTGATFCNKVTCRRRNILLIDDVLNTGRTLAHCLTEILKQSPKQVHTAILIARSHKLFPIEVNFVGYQLSAMLDNYVEVQFGKEAGAYLH